MSTQPPPPRPNYTKPWLPYQDQVTRLIACGLTVPDPVAAATFLSHINYYRFSGYCLAFEQQRHLFLPGVSFDDIVAAYHFDRELRDLITEALEVAEIDFRTAIAYRFGEVHGVFGHTVHANFYHRFDHADWLARLREEAERSSELFVEHFRSTYAEYPDLPVWVVTEVMSFGALSKMFKWMNRQDQRAVAARYGVQPTDLAAIIHHLVYVRNLCAHHSRLWDRVWAIKPSLPRGQHWQPPHLPSNERLYATVLILYHLLKRSPANAAFAGDWKTRLHALLGRPPSAPGSLVKMGLPSGWQANPLWN